MQSDLSKYGTNCRRRQLGTQEGISSFASKKWISCSYLVYCKGNLLSCVTEKYQLPRQSQNPYAPHLQKDWFDMISKV